MPREYSVYILRCSDGSYYTGITNDLECRISQHQIGMNKDCYTFKRRPIVLVYSSEYEDVYDAISWEKQIKRWTGKRRKH